MAYQKTIKNPATCRGKGLHTGLETSVTFKPSSDDSGVKFVRLDVAGSPEIKADVNHVIRTNRGTTLGVDGGEVQTVEHVLSALAGMEIDNLVIELDGPELPALDGSAVEYVKLLKNAGIVTQNRPKRVFNIDRTLSYQDPERGTEIFVLPCLPTGKTGRPSSDFRISCTIDLSQAGLGLQFYEMDSLNQFFEEIAPARTFCFFSEIKSMGLAELARGGSLENTVVLIDSDVKGEELRLPGSGFSGESRALNKSGMRFENEPARHKILDLMGDLFLLGQSVKGHVVATRPGHTPNVAFVKMLRESL